MPLLHTINKSPDKAAPWHKMTSLIGNGDTLLLIEDACYASVQVESKQILDDLIKQKAIRVFVLKPDYQARGLPSPAPWLETDYKGFVSLTTETDKTISWGSE